MTWPRTLLWVILCAWPFLAFGFQFRPLSDHNLVPGQVIMLSWTPSGTGDIALLLIRLNDEHNAIYIVENTNNTGTYRWVVSEDLRVGVEYFIQISNEHDLGSSDKFWINDTSSSTSTSGSLSSATTGGPSESTTMPVSTTRDISSQPTTFTTAVSPTTAGPTGTSSASSSPDAADTGLSPSGRTALIVCLALGVPITCIGLLFRYYVWRHPRSADTEERAAPTFFQWLTRRDHGPSIDQKSPTDTMREKRVSEYAISSPTISQGVRSSQATQDSGMWHYKPELAGSDPRRESGMQFLAPVELPAWDPEELDPSGKPATEEQREVHEKGDQETATESNTKAK